MNEPSERLRRFIRDHLDSVELLRLLLLLHASPARRWTATELNQELRSAESSIEKRLAGLYARGVFLRREPGTDETHSYRPADAETAAAIDELAEQAKVRLYAIIDLIYAKPQDTLRAFADAFRIRPPGKDE